MGLSCPPLVADESSGGDHRRSAVDGEGYGLLRRLEKFCSRLSLIAGSN